MFRLAEARVRQRQLELRLRSAELRAALQQDGRALQTPLLWADRGLQAWAWLRGVPWTGRLLASGAALLLLRRPSRLLGLAARGFGWWRLAQRLLALWRRAPPPSR